MKRFLFTMMMLVALVLLANTTFAQEASPVVGASYGYTVATLSNGDTYQFELSTSTTTVSGTVSGTITPGTATGTVGAVIDQSTNTATITWNSTDTNYLWITVTSSSTNCFNMRYMEITPTDNQFNAELLAIGTSVTSTTYPSWTSLGGTTATDCHVYAEGADFNISGGSDGSSYAFFRVHVTARNSTSNTWDLSVSMSSGDVEYWDGSDWQTSLTNVSGNQDDVLVRVTSLNAPAGTTLTGSVTATEDEGLSPVADNDGADNGATLYIDAYPDLSGASFGN